MPKVEAMVAVPPQVLRHSGLELPAGALTQLVKSILGRGMPVRFTAKGSSMSPFIRHGDVITVQPMRSHPARVGEIAAFIHPDLGTLMVHRVLARGDGSYLVKADNAPTPDGWIPVACALGCVSRIERCGRDTHLGLGWERRSIAWLSRRGMLLALLEGLRRARRARHSRRN